jgi:hypothetical protein
MTFSIEPSLMSIGALLLIVADYREMGMFGLEHPVFAVSASAAYAFRDNVSRQPHYPIGHHVCCLYRPSDPGPTFGLNEHKSGQVQCHGIALKGP